MSQLTRREMIVKGTGLAGLAAVGGLAAACSSPSKPSGPSGQPNGTITVWQHESMLYRKVFERLIAEYHAKYPAVTVEPLYIPYGQLDTKLLTAFSGGNPPDVLKTGGWQFANYASKNVLAPIDVQATGHSSMAALKAAYAPNALSQLSFEGAVYGLPIDYNSMFLFYRRDAFSEAGLNPDRPPTTWEEVIGYGKKLVVRGSNGQISRDGFAWVHGQPIYAPLQMVPLVRGAGGSILNSDGTKGTLNSAAGIEALDYYSGMARTAKIESLELTDPAGPDALFGKGKLALYLAANYLVAELPTYSPSNVLGKTFDVAPVPQWANATSKVAGGYTWGWGVAKASQNQFTAWHFLGWLQSSANVDAQLSEAGLITPVKNWQQLPSARGKGAQIVAHEIPYTDFGPIIPQWNEMAKSLSDNADGVAQGQDSALAAATNFDTSMDGVL